MSAVLEDAITYEFVASDKTVIRLRRMSDRQRTRYTSFTLGSVSSYFMKYAAATNVEGGNVVDPVEVQPLYDDYHRIVVDAVRDLLVDPAQVEVLNSWDHPGDWPDLVGLLTAIGAAEMPRDESAPDIPKPELVDGMNDKEVQRLGEDSAPKLGVVNTTRSKSRTATSSSGAESTKDEKPATSEMSPSAS
jgi:hypothetical protein